MDLKPEDIKRQAIAFAKYYSTYRMLVLSENLKGESPKERDEDTLYQEFTEGKPVSI